MRVVAQRAASGSVRWEEAGAPKVATIGPGLVLLVGAGPDDDETIVRRMADKLIDLRVFADEAGRMNPSLPDVKGEGVILSQFTPFPAKSRGCRAALARAADPQPA